MFPALTTLFGFGLGSGLAALALGLRLRRVRREFADEAADVAEALDQARGELADTRAERDYFQAAHEEAFEHYHALLSSPEDYAAVRAALMEDGLL